MKVAIFDTETTGLIANSLIPLEKRPRVIEFFGHIVDDESGAIEEELEFLCDPGVKISDKIETITGIKREQLIGLPGWKARHGEVAAFFSRAEAVAAHNLSYDLAMVSSEAERCGGKIEWPPIKFCTVEGSEQLKGFRLSLSALHEELFGEKFEGAHRARVDVEASTRCFLELRKRGEI